MEFPQFIVQNVSGTLLTELVIREGGGYATTKRQKDIADENDRRNIQAMEQAMRRLVTISGRSPALK
jgi:tRNA(His) 5'-end guanylyltransferase